MIVYNPFWDTMKKNNISTYVLITRYNISSSTISRLKNNKPITTTTLNDLCRILHCSVEDIIEYIDLEKKEKNFNG